MRFYECRVRHAKVSANGTTKMTATIYVVRAESFTEAEANVIQLITPFTDGDIDVIAISRTEYESYITQDGGGVDRWFKAKVTIAGIDEIRGVPKDIFAHFLVNAPTFEDAKTCVTEYMSVTQDTWELTTINDTKIVDVYVPHRP